MTKLLRHGELYEGGINTAASDRLLEWTARLALLATGHWLDKRISRLQFDAMGRQYYLRCMLSAEPKQGTSLVISFRRKSRIALVMDPAGTPVLAQVHRLRADLHLT